MLGQESNKWSPASSCPSKPVIKVGEPGELGGPALESQLWRAREARRASSGEPGNLGELEKPGEPGKLEEPALESQESWRS